jgi:hypothetical protein
LRDRSPGVLSPVKQHSQDRVQDVIKALSDVIRQEAEDQVVVLL